MTAHRERMRRVARALLAVAIWAHALGVASFLVVLSLFGESSRVTFLLLHVPRHPWLIAAALLSPIALVQRRWVLVAVEAVALLVTLFPLMGMRVGWSRSERGHRLRVLTYNVFFGKLGRPQLVEEIAASGADVVVLQASPASLAERLAQRMPGPTSYKARYDGEFVMVTRLRVRDVEVPEPLADGTPAMWARYALEGPGGPFQVVSFHPFSPRAGIFDREDPRIGVDIRDRQVASAVAATARTSEPFVLAGDSNLPGLSALHRKHLSGMRDAFDDVGFGFGYTFPAKYPWMRIDRVLGGKVRFLSVAVGARGASDHRSVVADFELEAP
ncbi:MAG: endonuclease/exonuclease/phosphatase family protein [Deltaproteobacteria bacterium]|nr:endonuclease/exonuclease/phosphatase family protein [Deltaproteobacteria bacterium]